MDKSKAKYKNELPCDGEVYFVENLVGEFDCDQLLLHLLHTIPWENDTVKLFGKTIECKRKTAWIADEGISYTYSGTKKIPHSWTPELFKLKQHFEEKYGFEFNSCLLNLYEDGSQYMSWHSDNEATLGKEPIILSLSLGAERKFSFKHKSKAYKTELHLKHGSVLVMAGKTQAFWKHSLPKSSKVKALRMNLTFRKNYLP